MYPKLFANLINAFPYSKNMCNEQEVDISTVLGTTLITLHKTSPVS